MNRNRSIALRHCLRHELGPVGLRDRSAYPDRRPSFLHPSAFGSLTGKHTPSGSYQLNINPAPDSSCGSCHHVLRPSSYVWLATAALNSYSSKQYCSSRFTASPFCFWMGPEFRRASATSAAPEVLYDTRQQGPDTPHPHGARGGARCALPSEAPCAPVRFCSSSSCGNIGIPADHPPAGPGPAPPPGRGPTPRPCGSRRVVPPAPSPPPRGAPGNAPEPLSGTSTY